MIDAPPDADVRLDGSEPLYRQVRAALQQMVEHSEYEPGDRIPSERELAERLGVSRVTVRRAIDDLIRLGLLERRSTSGTYVRNAQFLHDVGGPAVGLSQRLREAGGEPSSRLLTFEILPAPGKVAQRLELTPGAPVVLSRRLRLVNGLPVALESSYLPQARVPGLAAADLVEGSLFQILRERYGLTMGPYDDVINLSWAAPDEADLLGLPADSPVLLLRSVVCDAAGRPIEYLVSVNHPERVAFHMSGGPSR